MSKIQSDNIFVFPCASRESEFGLASKLLSEKNITNILKSITDKPSYIISWKDSILKCVVKGYYFEILNEELSGNKYAHLIWRGDTLDGADTGNYFAGLDINETEDGADLTLCKGDNVPDASWVKFTTKSLGVDLTKVDCGELE